MRDPVEIRDGDLVMVSRAGLYVAVVQRAGVRDLVIEPCDPSIPDRRVRVDEVQTVYRNIGRPGVPPQRLRPSPRQLRLDEDRGG
ncbi:MAG: hypothetical protein QOF29_4089 [bacterium]|jgi:hypothetical protein|nr:hypothetical protein [Solirubrobacteraceae bacterium]